MKIAIDFDGTCVTHEYPHVGKDIGAVPVLKKLVKTGHLLILNTMRSGKELHDAVDWFKKNDIPLYGTNEDPGQKEWTKSPKVFANLYIDDAALGCPLVYPVKGFLPGEDKSGRPYVDWEKVDEQFSNNDIYHSPDPVLSTEKMKAVLEIELPENCRKCKLCHLTNKETSDHSGFYEDYFCILVYADVGVFDDNRCPDCPLKIMEKESQTA